MSGNFKLEIANHQKMIDELFAEQAKKQQAEADQARLKAESNHQTMLFLERFMDASIRVGSLNSSQVELYLTQIRKAYGDQATICKYVSVVTRLLTHDFYGVESNTFRPGNGGLIFKGESYKDSKELYEYFVSFMADFDPLDSQVWFDHILTQVFSDPTFLPAEVKREEWRTRFVPKLQELVEEANNSVSLPDLDSLTTEDSFLIQSLMGGF
ncbi:MAG: hypothetical protein HWQ43_09685 [Nostoc sp. JL31]|uniref:hypothetical protein n=1 Tax=Nostoc sp. JL31 TaxID=2815395 RepID=UPI0025D532EE|nr:hypothetical protein [Nostoc sp. JL31]MBN3889423.1 hypothetical protein [Nostoc sp. JL31]